MSELPRRDFLKLACNGLLWLSGTLTLGGLLRFLNFDPNPPTQTQFNLGPAVNYPLNSRTIFANIPAVLLHTENGFAAMSLTCTHLGCTLKKETDGYACPCHGSRFDEDGKVTHGPAQNAMHHLQVEKMPDGLLILYTQ